MILKFLFEKLAFLEIKLYIWHDRDCLNQLLLFFNTCKIKK